MALTPRSFFRSPTLLVAALLSGAIAIGGLALLGFVLLRPVHNPAHMRCPYAHTRVYHVDRLAALRSPDCNHLLTNANPDPSKWNQSQWVDLGLCHELAHETHQALTTAQWGLRYYPHSEDLNNIKGYELMYQRRYDAAVTALRVARHAVPNPKTGLTENNLTWASLYTPRRMTLMEARQHYQRALQLEPNRCEYLQTGMWVEYGIAARTTGQTRSTALNNYRNLRKRYEPCTDLNRITDTETAFEIAGAGITDREIAKISMVQMFENQRGNKNALELPAEVRFDHQLVSKALSRIDVRTLDPADACEQIAPLTSARSACRRAVQAAQCAHR